MIEAADQLRDIQAGEWRGQAGDAFRLLIGEQPAHYERAGLAFAEASRTTAQYAEVLREAQFDARRAITLYEQAEAQTKDWKRQWDAYEAEVRAASQTDPDAASSSRTSPHPSSTDPGAGDRATARRLLDEARDRVDAQARSTASVLSQAEEAAPKKPGLLDSIFNGIKDFFGGVWDTTIGGIWDSIEALLDDPGQWVKDVWDNFYDHIAIWNWDTFKDTWIDFGKEFLAWDEWAKNPWRALGIVTANVVLAATGVGLAVKGTKWLLKLRKFRPRAVADKIPKSWGEGKPNRKGKGWRWDDGKASRNSVRVDKGDPKSPYPSQRVDHVRVNSGGRPIGRDGEPIPNDRRVRDDPENTHIPLSEYKKWKKWNKP